MKKLSLKIIVPILLFVLILVAIIIVVIRNPKEEKDYKDLGRNLYNNALNAYLRIDVDYEKEYIEEKEGYAAKYFAISDNLNMYKINNFEDIVSKIFTEEAIDKYKKINNVVIIGEDYYISSNELKLDKSYIKTKLKTKEKSSDKVTFDAISYFCTIDKCMEEDYLEVSNSFEIVKKDNEWFVSKFVFPELKK